MNRYWIYIYTSILIMCLILITIGFKSGLAYQSLSWKITMGVCAGFGFSALMNLRRKSQETKDV
ncbi:hypothetical protein QUF99_01380 [Bacillus sp. DX4.1]|uniref:hypothetical protein n=1 Tax=Bacillus sp. DX4.1 TaxID=3055867 RepID=UPI0025A05AF1|nr:hypothetical protein [Bacillus sp. DX4.1]MDM5186119.1 hypothetical protein [Bacillus sp. DX4.1]